MASNAARYRAWTRGSWTDPPLARPTAVTPLLILSLLPTDRSRFDPDRSALAELLDGEPRYRVDQVWDGLYRQAVDPGRHDERCPRRCGAGSNDVLPPALTMVAESVSDAGDTVKWLWGLADGRQIETVLMLYAGSGHGLREQPGRLCDGLRVLRDRAGRLRPAPHDGRDRGAGHPRRAPRAASSSRRVSNVVFMGMGEPLANYDRTWAAIRRLHDDVGLSARHITRVDRRRRAGHRSHGRRGSPGQPRRVAARRERHAARRARADQPSLPARRPGQRVRRGTSTAKGRRLSFEWALIDGVNDRADRCRGARGLRPAAAAPMST